MLVGVEVGEVDEVESPEGIDAVLVDAFTLENVVEDDAIKSLEGVDTMVVTPETEVVEVDEIEPLEGIDTVPVGVSTLEDVVVAMKDPVVVVLVPPPSGAVSGVCTQVDTATTLSSPFIVIGVNCTLHTWITGLPLLWWVMSKSSGGLIMATTYESVVRLVVWIDRGPSNARTPPEVIV